LKIQVGILVICIFFSISSITNVFGHGLGGEVLPSIMIEDQEVNLSIGISPSVYDNKHLEQNISLKLFDSNSYAMIEHVNLNYKKMENKFLKMFFMMNLVI
jgi:hypothetical protein